MSVGTVEETAPTIPALPCSLIDAYHADGVLISPHVPTARLDGAILADQNGLDFVVLDLGFLPVIWLSNL